MKIIEDVPMWVKNIVRGRIYAKKPEYNWRPKKDQEAPKRKDMAGSLVREYSLKDRGGLFLRLPLTPQHWSKDCYLVSSYKNISRRFSKHLINTEGLQCFVLGIFKLRTVDSSSVQTNEKDR